MEVKSKIIISIIAGVALYAVLSIYADINQLIIALGNFNWMYIPLILGLTILNYILRFIKWDYYLQLLGIKISKKNSVGIFLSGLSMSITPAKLGETFKSYLLKELNGIEISKTIPIIFAERSTDLVGLLFLASIGYSTFKYGKEVLIVTTVVILIGILIIQSKELCLKLINLEIPIISKFAGYLRTLYESAYVVFRIRPLIIAIVISISSWFFECLSLFLILNGLGSNVPLLLPVFAYSFSTVAGAISMIPGGLGVAEGSLAGILILSKITKTNAIASTLLIRFSTLWFGVLVGIISLSIYGLRKTKLRIDIDV